MTFTLPNPRRLPLILLLLGACEESTPTPSGSPEGGLGHDAAVAGAKVGITRLIAIGDTGEGNPTQHAVADQMNARCAEAGGCTAVLVLGDNFYDQGVSSADDAQWLSKFEQPYDRPELTDLKFYAVLGNHDYGLTSSGSAQAQIDYSSLPVGQGPGKRPSAMWTMPAHWYDVSLGDVHLFAIDTQAQAGQGEEMRRKVEESQATWKIVFGHHPRYTAGDHNKDNWLVDLASGTYATQKAAYCGADLYLAGHDHNMELIDKGRDPDCPNTYFAVSGAGSKLRASGGVVRPEDGPGEYQRFYDETHPGFAWLEFTDKRLHLEFVSAEGEVLFATDLRK